MAARQLGGQRPDTTITRGSLPFAPRLLLVAALIGAGSFGVARAEDSGQTDVTGPRPVAHVDLERYTGTWHEISRIPNWFQAGCAHGTTATYTLRPDGMIEVVNRCQGKDGSENTARGIARVVDATTNARLEVSFVRFLGKALFWGDYWIIGLGRDYEYAIVGTPSRKYGWVLSRTPTLAPALRTEITTTLREQGYDPAEFEPSAP